MIDAIDSIKFKAALIYHCKRNRIPVITTGAAGGLTDPTRIMVKDLSRTFNDPLAARVRGVLRRARPADPLPDVLSFGDLVIHPATRDVLVDGRAVELTAREFDLLCHLASSPRQVFSRGQLLRDVWDSSPDWQDPATVTVHVRRLRTKVEADPSRPRHLVTVRGAGYRFEP